MNYIINYSTGGACTQPRNPILIGNPNFTRDLMPLVFQYITIHEIYNTCITNSQTCINISWKAILENKGISHENLTVTPQDRVIYGELFPILEDSKEQKYCIIFFKYSKKCKRNNDDIYRAVHNWCTTKEEAIERYGHIRDWDTSTVTNMGGLFHYKEDFNENLSQWDVSNVINMASMFYYARSFTSDLSNWNMGSVTDMGSMFFGATTFTSKLSRWNTNSVTNMMYMFYGAITFTSDLSSWNTNRVTNMESMFHNATSFTSDLSSWNTRSVPYMRNMFQGAIAMLVKPGWYTP